MDYYIVVWVECTHSSLRKSKLWCHIEPCEGLLILKREIQSNFQRVSCWYPFQTHITVSTRCQANVMQIPEQWKADFVPCDFQEAMKANSQSVCKHNRCVENCFPYYFCSFIGQHNCLKIHRNKMKLLTHPDIFKQCTYGVKFKTAIYSDTDSQNNWERIVWVNLLWGITPKCKEIHGRQHWEQ